MFLSGCTNQNSNLNNNGGNENQQNSQMDLKSIVQLTDFTNDLDHKYSSISGNGQKIIYVQYPDDDYTYYIGDTDFVHTAWSLWVSDTSGSKTQTEIFPGYTSVGKYGFSGSSGGTPVLDYDANYAYFGVVKYIDYEGYYWLPAHNPDYLARVKLSDNSFHPIDLIQHPDYDFVWLQCFRLGSDNIYCLVTFSDEDGMGTATKGIGFMKMNLDGSDQEFIYTNTDLTSDACPSIGYTFFVDESNDRIYYESKNIDYYYYLDLNTNTPVKINNEELGSYWMRSVYDSKLIFSHIQEFYIYDINTGVLSKVQNEEDGSDSYTMTSDKIFYCLGSGLFSYTDYEGNSVCLIGMDEANFSAYNGIYTWDTQFTPTNGKAVSEDGTKLLVKEIWQDFDNPNYYILNIGT